jgi:hypothetical protein
MWPSTLSVCPPIEGSMSYMFRPFTKLGPVKIGQPHRPTCIVDVAA